MKWITPEILLITALTIDQVLLISILMTTIHITRSHQLDQDTVRNKVQELADLLGDKLSADYKWQEDRLVFNRSGASGFVRLGNHELEVEVKLGMLLRPLKGTIEKSITDYLDQRLS